MFRKEIKFIYDFNLNKVRKLGAYLTYEQIKKAKIHPAILHYISAEIDFLIFEDRQKILKDSIFDYSGEKISNLFYQISDEVKKNKRFSIEYIAQLILHSASFTVNYLARPRWALMKLIFEDDEHKGTTEIKQILNYVFYYSYLNKIITSYINRKKILSLNYNEFEDLLNKIDDLGFQSDMQGILDSALKSMADFFNMGEPHKHLIPLQSVELFLREKNLTPHLLKLREAFPQEDKLIYDIKDYQKAFSSLTKEELDELKQHDAAELDKSTTEEAESISEDEYDSEMKIQMAEDEETVEEPITAPVTDEHETNSEEIEQSEEQPIEEQAEEDETEPEIDEVKPAEQESEPPFAKATPADKPESELESDTTENEIPEDEIEHEHVIDETEDIQEVVKDEHEEVVEYDSSEDETPEEDNVLEDVEEQIEPIIEKEETTTPSIDDQQTEESEDENVKDGIAVDNTSLDDMKTEVNHNETETIEEEVDDTNEEEIKAETAHVIEAEDEGVEFEEDVIEMNEEEIKNKDSIDEFEIDEEQITETQDVKPELELESEVITEINDEVEEDKNDIPEQPESLPEKDEDELSLFSEVKEVHEEDIDSKEEATGDVEHVKEKSVDESTSQEDSDEDVPSEDIIEEPKDDKQEEETLTDTETEAEPISEPESEHESENEIVNESEEKTEADTKSDVVEDYEDFSDIIEERPVVEKPEESEEEEAVSESENIKIEMSELLERKNMTKVIEVIFDYDIEEFANVIDSSCKCNSKTEATEYLDGYFKSNHISTASKEAETLKSVISEYFDHKTK